MAGVTMAPLNRHNAEFADATAIAAGVRNGAGTAVAAVTNAREFAELSGNAFLSCDWDRAVATATAIDARRARGERLGALAGVPLAVVDLIAVAGLPATLGSRAWAGDRDRPGNIPTVTAPAVRRLLDADAVPVGKTNCPEFGFGGICAGPVIGATENPRYPAATPGDSAGGIAAALAAGSAALGLGVDLGGELRWSAQCTGLTALRTTPGIVPAPGQLPGAAGDLGHTPGARPTGMRALLQTIGPMARSARDLRLAFDLLSGTVDDERCRIRVLRYAWSDGSHLGPVCSATKLLMVELATRLLRCGGQVTNTPGIFDHLPDYERLRAADPLIDHLAATAGVEDLVEPGSLRVIRDSLRTSPAAVAAARGAAEYARARALRVFEEFDVVLLPVAAGPAADPDGLLLVGDRLLEADDLPNHCRAVTMTGCPVVSIPVGLSDDALPLSIQVIAAPGNERLALMAATEVEAVLQR